MYQSCTPSSRKTKKSWCIFSVHLWAHWILKGNIFEVPVLCSIWIIIFQLVSWFQRYQVMQIFGFTFPPYFWQQIHSLVMSLHYTGIEIKTAHSLESWNGGVLVMVSGSVLMKNFSGRRKFAQTFFLAPQEKGYFVLNDIFHFIDDEPFLHHPVAYLPQSSLDSKVHAPATIREPGTMIEPLGLLCLRAVSLEKAFLFFINIFIKSLRFYIPILLQEL